MAIRLLLLTQWFDPEPTFKGLAFAQELIRQGFDVEVVTGFPNYPGGKLYPGYRVRLLQRELINGVKITRVALYPSHDQSAAGRMINYVSFAASALVYCLFRAKRPDVIYAYHPPLTVGITAALTRLFRRIPVVYDVQDMWPDTLRATGMFSNKQALQAVSLVCHWVYRNIDQIVVLSPGFKQLLIERGVPEKKIEVIYNWCNEEALNAPAVKVLDAPLNSNQFQIVFAGNMGKAQSLYTVLDAAKLLQQHNHHNILFTFVGGGIEVDGLKKYSQEQQLQNVCFLPQVSMSDVGSILKAADVLLVHLKKDPLFKITIPSKTQAYMAVGKPILMALDGDAASLIRECNCGEIAIPDDPESIAAAALALQKSGAVKLNKMADNGQRFYQKKLALQVGVKHFAAIFKRFANKGEPTPNVL